MASFFSADYWKALYFKAMGGQATAVDPNAMSGSFAGSASFTGTLDNGIPDAGGADPDGAGIRRKKKRPILYADELIAPKSVEQQVAEYLDSLNAKPPKPPVKPNPGAQPAGLAELTDEDEELIILMLAA